MLIFMVPNLSTFLSTDESDNKNSTEYEFTIDKTNDSDGKPTTNYRSTATAVTSSNDRVSNCIQYIFQTFVKTITKNRPVILFMDDLQWCDYLEIIMSPCTS